jgi:hypothetical protein
MQSSKPMTLSSSLITPHSVVHPATAGEHRKAADIDHLSAALPDFGHR